MNMPNILVLLVVLMAISCSGEKGPCKQCIEDMTRPAVQFSCNMWLDKQGKKSTDPGWTAAYDDCVKKGLEAALKNENNLKDTRERCQLEGRCEK
ncbi:MAG TPA: hypothetical protein P5077_02480 [bacterium]|nr:hypothetical protein [bacterium]